MLLRLLATLAIVAGMSAAPASARIWVARLLASWAGSPKRLAASWASVTEMVGG